MRILQVTPSLANAGAERFLVDISNELLKAGNSVTIISLVGSYDKFTLSNEIDDRIRLIFLQKPNGFSFGVFIKLNNLIRNGQYDIIHTHTRALNYVSPFNLLNSRFKFIHTIHNDAIKESRNKFIRLFRRQLFRLELVYPVCISQTSYNSFKKVYKLNAKVIKNGTRKINKSKKYKNVQNFVESLKFNRKTKVFTNIARISDQKNQELLIDVFKRLNDESVNAILLIIGGIRHKHIYNKIKMKATKNVFFLGELDNATDYLFVSDFFCLSSLWEGMPISLIESFSIGCIPICTPAGGINNMLSNDKNGYITDDFTIDSYYKAVISCINLKTKKIRNLKISCNQSFDKEYSILICSTSYQKYFQKILNNANIT